MRKTRLIVSIVGAATLAVACQARFVRTDRPVLVGALEDVPGRFTNEPSSRKVRVLFRKSGDEWQAFESHCPDEACLKQAPSAFPRTVTWTVIYNGRTIGMVDAETPAAFDSYSHTGLQAILPEDRVPTVGERSLEWAGFLDQPVYRPLVTVSAPEWRDPDDWKQTAISEQMRSALRRAFRAKFPNVENCTTPEENLARRWVYSDEDIGMTDAHASNKNWSLATVSLRDYRCDGPPDAPYVDQLFSVDPAGRVAFIGGEMRYLDAGDYDDDGRSELVLSIDGYNRGGYALLFDEFARRATFEFNYH